MILMNVTSEEQSFRELKRGDCNEVVAILLEAVLKAVWPMMRWIFTKNPE
jgi:hypothetical protein